MNVLDLVGKVTICKVVQELYRIVQGYIVNTVYRALYNLPLCDTLAHAVGLLTTSPPRGQGCHKAVSVVRVLTVFGTSASVPCRTDEGRDSKV